MRTFAKPVLLACFLSSVVYFFSIHYARRAKGTDFPEFYSAAEMVRHGDGRQLYSYAAQDHYQSQYAGRVGTYFNHLPFELLLYLPLSFFPLPAAYALWCVVNAILLALVAALLRSHLSSRWDWPILCALFLLFPPVALTFYQGQDSLLVLLALTAAVVFLKKENDFAAGCTLACGLIKFHLILLFALAVFFYFRRSRILAGFALLSAVFLALSVLIAGWTFPSAYIHFLTNSASVQLAGIHPSQMANLRGLIARSGAAGTTGFVFTLSLSILIAWLVLRTCSKAMRLTPHDQNLVIANCLFASLLVSYHMSPHDLSLLIFPIALLLENLSTPQPETPRWLKVAMIACAATIYLPPLYIFLIDWHAYAFACVPLLLLFALTQFEIERRTAL